MPHKVKVVVETFLQNRYYSLKSQSSSLGGHVGNKADGLQRHNFLDLYKCDLDVDRRTNGATTRRRKASKHHTQHKGVEESRNLYSLKQRVRTKVKELGLYT